MVVRVLGRFRLLLFFFTNGEHQVEEMKDPKEWEGRVEEPAR